MMAVNAADTIDTGVFIEHELAVGMRLFIAPTTKFKRTRVTAFIHDQLDPDRVARGALLPYIQKRGSVNHPTGASLERAAASLYDASLSGGVHKIGDRQVLSYTIDLPGDRFLSDPIFQQGIDLLAEVFYDPATDGDGLQDDYVEQEKRFQVGRIQAQVNNKLRYALQRASQEMFAGEPFAQHQLGTEEGVQQATPANLLEHHQQLTSSRPVDIYVVGDVEPDDVKDTISAAFSRSRHDVTDVPPTSVDAGQGDMRHVTDEEVMNQGWLVVGLRSDMRRCDPDRYGMLFFNGILGGFAHSKLFINVREKASLAYAAFSFYDGNKGVISALAGIDVNKFDQAREIILAQIDDVAAGRFSEEELEATRRAFLTQFRLRLDSAEGRILQHLGGSAEGCAESIPEVLHKIERVSREHVQAAAERIRPDMVYFLKGTQ